MKFNRINKALLLIIIVSLIVSLFQIGVRVSAEKKENTLDIAADYYTFQMFANSYGKTAYDAIEELGKNGITSVAIPEQSVQDVVNNGKVLSYAGSDVLAGNIPLQISGDINFSEYMGTIKAFYTVLITKDKSLASRIAESLPEGTKLISGRNGTYAIIVHSDPTDAVNFGIGFDNNMIQNFKNLGLNVILRPRYVPGNRNLESLEDTIKRFDIHSVMFYGSAIFGAGGDATASLANFFKQNHVVTYIVELPVQKGIYNQEGLPQLIKETNYYVARVYSIYPAEQLKLSPIQIFNRWFRSVSDRNIRVIYVKPVVDTGKSYQYNMGINDYYVNKLHKLWQDKGMKFGVPHPMPEVNIHTSFIFLILLGVIALFMIYVGILFDIKEKNIILLFVILSLLGFALVIVSKDLSEKLSALSAAVVVTGMVSLPILQYIKKIYGKGKIAIIKVIEHGVILSSAMFGFSLIGALWISAVISSSPYLLNLDMFRGVKVLYLSPFIFLVVNYLYVFGADFNNRHLPGKKNDLVKESEKAWNITVKWGHIIILIVLAGVFLVYLLRSGNTGVSISSAELRFRDVLEHTIVARPRFKEFIIGYPSIFLAVLSSYLMRKKWIIIFSTLAIMGSISVVDTFSHLRETFLISMYRSLWGIGFGLIIGFIVILLVYIPAISYLNNEK